MKVQIITTLTDEFPPKGSIRVKIETRFSDKSQMIQEERIYHKEALLRESAFHICWDAMRQRAEARMVEMGWMKLDDFPQS